LTQRYKNLLQYIIIALVGGVFLYLVFGKMDWTDLKSKFLSVNYYWIGLGLIISLLSHYLRAYRATLLYEPLGYKVSAKNSFYAVIIGYAMNYLIPRAGEVSRCASLFKTDAMPVNKSLGTVVTERIFDMIILLFLLLFIFLGNISVITDYLQKNVFHEGSGSKEVLSYTYILIGAIIFGLIMLWYLRKSLMKIPAFSKVMNLLKGFNEGLGSIRYVKGPVFFVILSLSIWVCYILMMYFCLFSMEATSHLSFFDTLVVFAIGTIGVVIPAPAAGAGTYHFAVMQSLLIFGVPEADGVAYATVVHGAQLVLLVILGAISSGLVMLQQKRTFLKEN